MVEEITQPNNLLIMGETNEVPQMNAFRKVL